MESSHPSSSSLPTQLDESVQCIASSTINYTQGDNQAAATPPPPGQIQPIPGYEILGELGRGGMGVVYRARQIKADRVVALKMILAGKQADANHQVRFRLEAEAIARLQHPGIAQVFEVGEHLGLPFFSLEFCGGGNLSRKISGAPLPCQVAASLVEQLALAVHAAHEKNIIHRDLKPSNILLTETGTPKISDFGLAKKVDEDNQESNELTQSGVVMGTPSYMAPEQAAGRTKELGQGVDIYALGAILYETLTGRPPFRAATTLETLHQVLHADPAPPSRLNPAIPRDLETICLKCLAKEPERRYGSALELAEDLGRFQRSEPIRARPVGRVEKLWKWARRRPAAAALLCVSILAALVILGGFLWFTWSLDQANQDLGRTNSNLDDARKLEAQERQRAEASEKKALVLADEEKKARKKAEEGLTLNNMLFAQARWHEGRPDLAHELLDQVPPERRQAGWRFLKRQVEGSSFTLYGHAATVNTVAFSPDGERLASGSSDHLVKIWSARTGQELHSLHQHHFHIFCLAFSPDGQRLAAGGLDGKICLWEAASGKVLWTIQANPLAVRSLAFSTDGQRLASAAGHKSTILIGEIKVWDARTGQEIRQLGEKAETADHVCFSPDGRFLAAATHAGNASTLQIWDDKNGELVHRADFKSGTIYALSFTPDGSALAISNPNEITLWDTATWKSPRQLKVTSKTLAFSPDGQRLAVVSQGKIMVMDVANGETIATLHGHTHVVNCLAFSPDGRRLISGSQDATVKVWDLRPQAPLLTVKNGRAGGFTTAWFNPEGSQVTFSDRKGEGIKTCDAFTGKILQRIQDDDGPSIALSPEGKYLASAGAGNKEPAQVKVRNAATGQLIHAWTASGKGIKGLAMSKNGSYIAVASQDGMVTIWNGAEGRHLHSLETQTTSGGTLGFSPDGAVLAMVVAEKNIQLWDVQAGKERKTLKGHLGYVRCLAFDTAGKRLASGENYTNNHVIKIWDLDSGQEILNLLGHAQALDTVCFSADGQLLASGGNDGVIKLWDLASGQELTSFKGHKGPVHNLQFSPEGRRLLSNGQDSLIKIWEVPQAPETLLLRGHLGPVVKIQFSEQGDLLASTGADHKVNVWSSRTGALLHSFTEEGSRITPFFAQGDRWLGTRSSVRVQLRELPSGREMVPDKSFTVRLNGNRLAWGQNGGRVVIRDLASGQNVLDFQAHPDGISSLVFLDDDARLVTCGKDPTAKIWDVATGKLLFKLEGHTKPIFRMVLSPDGTRLATASGNPKNSLELGETEVKVWDPRTGRNLWSIQETTRVFEQFHFNKDGSLLCAQDTSVRWYAWETATGKPATAELSDTGWHSGQRSADGRLALPFSRNRILVLDPKVAAAEQALRAMLARPDSNWHAEEAQRHVKDKRLFPALMESACRVEALIEEGQNVLKVQGKALSAQGDMLEIFAQLALEKPEQARVACLHMERRLAADTLARPPQTAEEKERWAQRARGHVLICGLIPNSGVAPNRLLELTDKIENLDSGNPLNRQARLIALYRAGRFQESLKEYRNPAEPWARYFVIMAQHQLKMPGARIEWERFNRTLNNVSSPAVLELLRRETVAIGLNKD